MAWVFLTKLSSSPWTVPSDWNNADNDVYTIAAGGGGAGNGSAPTSGGGGGACSHVANLTLSGTAAFSVPAGGTAGTTGAGGDGSDCWFNGASFGASSVASKGGGGGKISPNPSATAGAGGLASGGIGTDKHSGGNGGTGAGGNGAGSGGGGAAGPTADGAHGGIGSIGGVSAGGGGGGADGGSIGGDASGSTGGSAGAGANSGGSGGAGKTTGTGNVGGNGAEFDASHGAGGGGGASGYSNNVGGAGGLYGGGGAGGAYSTAGGGVGGDGLIAIRYTPSASTTTVNLTGSDVTSAIGALVATTAETKALTGIASASAAGTVVAVAGTTTALGGASSTSAAGTVAHTTAATKALGGAASTLAAGIIVVTGGVVPPPTIVSSGGPIIARRNWLLESTAVLDGGAWDDLSRIIDIHPGTYATALGPEPSMTTFTVDLGAVRPVGLFNFESLCTSTCGSVRLRAGVVADFSTTLVDETISAWPWRARPYALSPWGRWQFWFARYETDEYLALGLPRYIVPSQAVSVRYIKVEIRDQTAVDRCRIGCFGAWEAYRLPLDMSVGWSISVVDPSPVNKVPQGTTYAQRRRRFRRLNVGFPLRTETEFFHRLFTIGMEKVASSPMVFMPTPDQVEDRERTTVYGLATGADFSNSQYALYDSAWAIEQLI